MLLLHDLNIESFLHIWDFHCDEDSSHGLLGSDTMHGSSMVLQNVGILLCNTWCHNQEDHDLHFYVTCQTKGHDKLSLNSVKLN